jgi:peptide deformylase
MAKTFNTLTLKNTELKTVCHTVDFVDPKKNLDVAHKLIRTMQKEKGMGLAANQCGFNLRLFVMRIEDKFYHCFNPEIVECSDEQVNLTEGCLSFIGQFCEVVRPKKIFVRYFSSKGEETVEWLDGWAARCFQHELDHLNGLTMFDR